MNEIMAFCRDVPFDDEDTVLFVLNALFYKEDVLLDQKQLSGSRKKSASAKTPVSC